MHRLLVIGLAALLAVMPAADAQTPSRPVPDDVRAAGEAVATYVRAMPSTYPSMFSDVNWRFNNPAVKIRTWVAHDLAEVKEDAAALAALKKPARQAKGFDLSFALDAVRVKADARLVSARNGLEAVEKMLDAQTAGDCAAYALQSAAFDAARREFQATSSWREVGAIEVLLTNFAGVTPPQPLQQVAAAPTTSASRLRLIAQELAVTLRCPLPRVAFDIDVSFPLLKVGAGKGPVFADIHVTSDLEASQRAVIETRFLNFKLDDTDRFAVWTDAKQPFKFHWDGEVMTAVLE